MDIHVFGSVTSIPQKRSFTFSASGYPKPAAMVEANGSSPSIGTSTLAPPNSTNQDGNSLADRPPKSVKRTDSSSSLGYHMSLLSSETQQQDHGELSTTPIFTAPVLEHAESRATNAYSEVFPQYGLLAGLKNDRHNEAPVRQEEEETETVQMDPRIFFNVAAPSSTFICGSQGSGKSHTLSCLLEACLIPSPANKLPRPLTGLVFHYDTFISDYGGSPCEAAYLSSDPAIKVRVLCSPTNLKAIRRTYQNMKVKIEPLILREQDLNTKRMLDLMAVTRDDGPMPLYLHTIYRILRDMRIEQQDTRGGFSYAEFKRRVMLTQMTLAQLGPLEQRLDTLESFMSKTNTGKQGNDWTPKPGTLTIVDLSCPCVTAEGACALFNVCLSIFLEQDTRTGRVIALDEAHKYMNSSAEASTLTSTLLSTIRLQRHLGARVIISTQEPTVSPALLDLSSITIVHRFTSPEWLRSLKHHLAAAASDLLDQAFELSSTGENNSTDRVNEQRGNDIARRIFGEIVTLRAGEALLFSPSAMVGLSKSSTGETGMKRLGADYVKVRIRKRLTADGGKSVMAT